MKFYTAEEIEIGKVYMRGNKVVILRERSGETGVMYNKPCNVYFFDELRDFIVHDWTAFSAPLQVYKDCRTLLNPEYKCFRDFDSDKFKKEKIEPLTNQVATALSFIE